MTFSINLDKLKPGATYNVQARGLFADQTGAWSTVYTFTTPSTTVATSNTAANIQLNGGSMYAGSFPNLPALTSSSGVIFNKDGLFGYNAGSSTFYITASGGDAYFAGTLNAITGSIGGWLISSNKLSSTQGTGKNLFSNYDPSFESSNKSGLNYWTAYAGFRTVKTIDSGIGFDGGKSLNISFKALGDYPDSNITTILIPTSGLLTSGNIYTFSGYVFPGDAGFSYSPSAQTIFYQYDSSRIMVASAVGPLINMTSGWTRAYASATILSNTAYVQFDVSYNTDGSGLVTGNGYDSANYDGMQLELSASPTTYQFSNFTGLYGTTSSVSQYNVRFGISETSDPAFSVDIFGKTQSKNIIVGNSESIQNIAIDSQNIQSQYNASAASLYLNKKYGGSVTMGDYYQYSIISYTVSANVITATISDTSSLRVGDPLYIYSTTATSGASINGQYTDSTTAYYRIVSIPTSTTFTFNHPSVTTGTGSGGYMQSYYESNLYVNGYIYSNNNFITINGSKVKLGDSVTISASSISASALTGTTLASNVVNSSLTSFGASPTFTGVVNLGANVATGSVQYSSSTGYILASNVSGSVTSALTAASANNIAVTDDNVNATRYLTFTSGSGTTGLLIDYTTSPLTYNPNTGLISALSLSLTPASAQNGLLIRGSASQSSNLTQWQNSSGSVLSYVDSNGFIFVDSTSSATPSTISARNTASGANNYQIQLSAQSNGPYILYGTTSNSTAFGQSGAFGSALTFQGTGRPVRFTNTTDSTAMAQIQGTGSAQTVDYLQIGHTLSGVSLTTILAKISANGALTLSPSSSTAATINAAASAIGLQVNANATGTADVARFYHTNGSTYSGFDNASRLFVRTSGTSLGTPSLGVLTATDTTIGAVIRGNSASQSANLQEWQNSAGSILAKVDSSGNITASGNVIYNQATNSQSGSAYTLVLTDAGKFIEMTSSAANTITVPAASAVAWTVGTRIDIIQYGAGTTTITPASGASVNYYSPTSAATRTIKAKYGAATLMYRTTNEWLLIGNLT
jgi:hypothetical protein